MDNAVIEKKGIGINVVAGVLNIISIFSFVLANVVWMLAGLFISAEEVFKYENLSFSNLFFSYAPMIIWAVICLIINIIALQKTKIRNGKIVGQILGIINYSLLIIICIGMCFPKSGSTVFGIFLVVPSIIIFILSVVFIFINNSKINKVVQNNNMDNISNNSIGDNNLEKELVNPVSEFVDNTRVSVNYNSNDNQNNENDKDEATLRNELEYKKIMDNLASKHDTYYDSNSPYIKILLIILFGFAGIGFLYYIIMWFLGR